MVEKIVEIVSKLDKKFAQVSIQNYKSEFSNYVKMTKYRENNF